MSVCLALAPAEGVLFRLGVVDERPAPPALLPARLLGGLVVFASSALP